MVEHVGLNSVVGCSWRGDCFAVALHVCFCAGHWGHSDALGTDHCSGDESISGFCHWAQTVAGPWGISREADGRRDQTGKIVMSVCEM